MLGQERLVQWIEGLAIVPHSILLFGDHDAGQKDICGIIAKKLGVELVEFKANQEAIMNMQTCPDMKLYCSNISEMSDKEQNTMLKVFEEPNPLTYIVLYGDNEGNVLETIENRASVWRMDKYRESLLREFATGADKEYVLKLFTTPTQVEVACNTDMQALIRLCDAIVHKMKTANFDNALTIADKINFSDEYTKFDLYTFYKVLADFALNEGACKIYYALSEMMKYIYTMNDKKRFFENFIINIWRSSRQ